MTLDTVLWAGLLVSLVALGGLLFLDAVLPLCDDDDGEGGRIYPPAEQDDYDTWS